MSCYRMTSAIVITLHGVKDDNGVSCAPMHDDALRYCDCSTAREFGVRSDGDWRILTIDDGLITDFTVVFPRLVALGLHGTFFVTASNVGRTGYKIGRAH